MSFRLRRASPASLLLALGACAAPGRELPPEAPEAWLWMRYDGDGTRGYATDPDIDDATRYYARAAADLSGLPGTAGNGVVPATLDAFKAQFNIPVRAEGEAVADYRDRIGAAVYFNANELGLGRELACSGPIDGGDVGFLDSDGQSVGIACFVTNYGGEDEHFYDEAAAMANALSEGPSPKNTVAITWRPTRPEHEQVQFWVYDAEGNIQPWAQLDHEEGRADGTEYRPVPSVCTECHGGFYTQGDGVARDAHFLPANPRSVHLDASPSGTVARLTALNCTALRSTTLTSLQEDWLSTTYGPDGPCRVGAAAVDRPNPGWEDEPELWTRTVLPYCATCHMAMPETDVVTSAATFRALDLDHDVLGVDGPPRMPHALPTFTNLWAGTDAPGRALADL